MLNRLFTILSLIICITFVGGCGDDSGTNTTPQGDFLKATFNGQVWNSTGVNAVHAQTFNIVNITATRGTGVGGENIAFTMRDITGPGTYKLGVMGNGTGQITTGGVLYTTGLDIGVEYGEVKITKFGNGRIAGTFNMTVYQDANMNNPARQVTDGSFDMAMMQ